MKLTARLVPLLFLAFLMALGLIASGCDRIINISGNIYEWVDAPPDAQSRIYHKDYTAKGLLKEDFPQDIQVKPLPNIEVICYGQAGEDTFYTNEITDENGRFRMLIRQGRQEKEYTTTVEVEKDGFYPAKRDFIDRGDSHSLNILMVRR